LFFLASVPQTNSLTSRTKWYSRTSWTWKGRVSIHDLTT
jgi:hypothetical protein